MILCKNLQKFQNTLNALILRTNNMHIVQTHHFFRHKIKMKISQLEMIHVQTDF